jgi:hypothetical protein
MLGTILRGVASALLTILAVPAAAAAQPLPVQPVNRAVHTIPIELYGNRVYLQVSGPGFGPRWFILDSGAQLTHYTSELVQEAGLRTSGRVGISGIGSGRIRGAFVAPTRLSIGSLQLPVRRGVSGPGEELFGSLYRGIGRRFDGVLGHDLFAAFIVEIDYSRRVIRLYEPGSYRPSPTAEAVPIRIVDNKPYVTVMVTAAGQTLPANLHIDTGLGGAADLNSNFVTRHGLLDRVGPMLTGATGGVGGSVESRVARLDQVAFGRLRMQRPVVGLILGHSAGVRGDSEGRIGGELLRRFTVTFDYPSRTMWLDPGAAVGDPFETDMSGLSLVAEGSDDKVVVARVTEGAPGAEAGVRAGDQLIAIDGDTDAARSLDTARGLLRRDGEQRELLLQRGAEQLRLRLTLRRRL